MILPWLIAVSLASTTAPAQAAPAASFAETSAEISHAIDAGRLDQAKLMIARLISNGERGPAIDRLIADLSFASGRNEEAFHEYKMLFEAGARDSEMCERGAIVSLKLAQLADAEAFVGCSTAVRDPTWRAWNACGVLADLKEDWAKAGKCYAKARALAPDRATVINNQGWSRLMRGDWAGAVPFFELAAKLEPDSTRIANNLELARAAIAAELPERKPRESAADWAARLNDAGVAAQLFGDKKRALAAFTQAIYANSSWYERAANNLELATKP